MSTHHTQTQLEDFLDSVVVLSGFNLITILLSVYYVTNIDPQVLGTEMTKILPSPSKNSSSRTLGLKILFVLCANTTDR